MEAPTWKTCAHAGRVQNSQGPGSTYNKLIFVLAMLLAVAKPASLRASHFRIKLCQSAALSFSFLALADKTGFRDVALPRVFADRQ